MSVISKRRQQSKVAIEAIVKEAYAYLDSTPDDTVKMELATTLKDICSGKIYVEAESARLHLIVAKILESQNDIDGACAAIQDVHVETYGSIPKKEKAEYILEQMRLNFKRRDYIRALIQSRKMNTKTLLEEGFEQIKVTFYTMMIEYYTHEKDAWEICQCYYKIFDTSITQENTNELASVIESCIVFLILSKFDNHVSDMLHRLKLVKAFEENSLANAVLQLFTTIEIVPFPFEGFYQLQEHACFNQVKDVGMSSFEFFQNNFKLRVIQRNLRVVAKYYTRMKTASLANMLGLQEDELEGYLSDMSSDGDIFVKIDRPQGIVSFVQPRSAEAVLSDWASDTGKLLNIMENTAHLINREMMIHKC